MNWRRNAMPARRSQLYTADDARLRLILRELESKDHKPDTYAGPGLLRERGSRAAWIAPQSSPIAGLRRASLYASSPATSAPSRFPPLSWWTL